MKAVEFPIDFDIESFLSVESPYTLGLFRSEGEIHDDLKALFRFPSENRRSMPFYVLNGDEVRGICETSEAVYAAMMDAVEHLYRNRHLVPHFFGEDFCINYPEFINYAFWTWEQNHEAMYGRFDMACDPGTGEVTGVYEFNGNTPVMLFESTALQNDLVRQVNLKSAIKYDQCNSYWDHTSSILHKLMKNKSASEHNCGVLLHSEYIEDAATCELIFQLFDSLKGAHTMIEHIDNMQFDMMPYPDSPFMICNQPMENMFVLQPWEEIVESCYHDVIYHWRDWCNKVRFFEPAWRWFTANKGIWALVTHLVENDKEYCKKYGHLPLLKTYMTPEHFLNAGVGFVSKPLIGRLSNNIAIFDGEGNTVFESDGAYGDIECVYQEYCAPGQIEGRNNFIAGVWMAPYGSDPLAMQASTFCIREFDKPVLDIKNERFIPHLVEMV